MENSAATQQRQQATQRTVNLLKKKMRENSDFPALSRTMHVINKQTSSTSDATINELTNTILNDYALSSKILKLINSVFYSQYHLGEKVSTISRAVFILGFEQLRKIALSMKLLEHLHGNAAPELKDTILMSLMSGIISKNIGDKLNMEDTEESFISSMFYNLGKLLTAYYLPDDFNKVNKLKEQKKVDENRASKAVLGINYEFLGISIAKGWRFPDQLVESMYRPPANKKIDKPKGVTEKLKHLSSFSNELSVIINERDSDPSLRGKEIDDLIYRFGNSFDINKDDLNGILEQSLEEVNEYSNIYKINLSQSSFIKKVNRAAREEQTDEEIESETISPASEQNIIVTDSQGIDSIFEDNETEETNDPESVLTRGIQDVTNSLMGSVSINDILRMILEITYRGLNLSRALICIRNTRESRMEGRFGFGSDIDDIIKNFKFQVTKNQDVFNMSLAKGSDIVINNVNSANIKPYIPDWYSSDIGAETFILLPLIVNNVPLGLIYADKPKAGMINIPPQQLTLLKTLRNQAVMAIKQSL